MIFTNQALALFPPSLGQAIAQTQRDRDELVEEICCRIGRPPVLLTQENVYPAACRAVLPDDLDYLLERATRASVYAAADQIRQGYLQTAGGCRVGLCGCAYGQAAGQIDGIRQLSSVSVRIPHAVPGCADALVPQLMKDGFCSTLILSPPGGGKTTLMETLAGELSKKGKVIITTTTHICRPKQYETLLDADEAAVSAALERSGIVCVASRAESGKLCAPWLSMGTLAQLADFVLVEADGAKRLPLKAHASHEPVIPEEAQRVIMVIGIDGVGKTIRETCHRSALYAQLAGVDEETVVTPQLAARVVNAEGYGDRVYINKVESAADYEAAQAMANEFSCPVIAGSLHQGVYVCLH